MRILVACEYSGIVRDAFISKGHYAMSCDLLPTESHGPHYQGDVTKIIDDGWDMMIAHPPCTYLGIAGARHMYPKGKINQDRLAKAMDARFFFMMLWQANIPKICIENPLPLKCWNPPQYTQAIQPYEFGHPFSKKTCLWIKNLPPLMATNICAISQSTKIPGNWFNKGGKDRQKNRAKFWPGIAAAMAEQWG